MDTHQTLELSCFTSIFVLSIWTDFQKDKFFYFVHIKKLTHLCSVLREFPSPLTLHNFLSTDRHFYDRKMIRDHKFLLYLALHFFKSPLKHPTPLFFRDNTFTHYSPIIPTKKWVKYWQKVSVNYIKIRETDEVTILFF